MSGVGCGARSADVADDGGVVGPKILHLFRKGGHWCKAPTNSTSTEVEFKMVSSLSFCTLLCMMSQQCLGVC